MLERKEIFKTTAQRLCLNDYYSTKKIKSIDEIIKITNNSLKNLNKKPYCKETSHKLINEIISSSGTVKSENEKRYKYTHFLEACQKNKSFRILYELNWNEYRTLSKSKDLVSGILFIDDYSVDYVAEKLNDLFKDRIAGSICGNKCIQIFFKNEDDENYFIEAIHNANKCNS